MTNQITYKLFGDNAIIIEWEPIIDKKILSDIITYKEKILQSDLEYLDIIQAYNSLTIVFNFKVNNVKNKIFKLQSIYSSTLEIEKKTLYKWEIPVCYDLDFGIDLKEISKKLKISIDEIKFRSISKEEFYQIEKDITVNVFKIHKTLKYD